MRAAPAPRALRSTGSYRERTRPAARSCAVCPPEVGRPRRLDRTPGRSVRGGGRPGRRRRRRGPQVLPYAPLQGVQLLPRGGAEGEVQPGREEGLGVALASTRRRHAAGSRTRRSRPAAGRHARGDEERGVGDTVLPATGDLVAVDEQHRDSGAVQDRERGHGRTRLLGDDRLPGGEGEGWEQPTGAASCTRPGHQPAEAAVAPSGRESPPAKVNRAPAKSGPGGPIVGAAAEGGADEDRPEVGHGTGGLRGRRPPGGLRDGPGHAGRPGLRPGPFGDAAAHSAHRRGRGSGTSGARLGGRSSG
jgi:hypothetical protein